MTSRALRLLGAVVTVGLLFSCGARSQLQVVADARAEAQAYKQAPADKKPAIAEALANNVLAVTAPVADDLPAPSRTIDSIVADPAPSQTAAATSATKPPANELVKKGTDKGESELHRIGVWGIRAGTAMVSLAVLLFVLSFFPAIAVWVRPLVPWIEELAILGAAVLALGLAFAWLSAHLWVVYVAPGTVAVLLALRYRSRWLPVLRRVVKG